MKKTKIENKTCIVVSQELKAELDKFGNKGDTYNDIVWRLVEIDKKEKKKAKE